MLSAITRKKRLFKKSIVFVFILLMTSSLFACSKDEPQDMEVYILEIDDEIIPTNEIMVYMYQVVEEFQNIGGEEVWEFEDFSGGKSAIEVAKDAIIENILRIKVLNKKSSELNISLTDDEVTEVKESASEYLKNMSGEFISENNITLALMEDLFYEFALSEKVVSHITNDYKPADNLIEEKMLENEEYARLSQYETEELLTEYNVSHILFQTRKKDQSGEYVMLTDSEKELKYNVALEILSRANIGEDFKTLMNKYSEESFEVESEENGKYQFSKALLPVQFKEGLINLEIGQVSDVIESESGYHIFKVNDIKVPSEEEVKSFEGNFVLYLENLRASVIGELKKEAFNEIYFKWKESVNISIDRVEWDKIDLRI